MTTKSLKRLGVAALMALAAVVPAAAQTPTPEGTVITNTATVSFTDANGNAYTPATGSVSVTVGFLSGLDVTSGATVTPASPSTGNQLAFTIANIGNGADSVSVSTTAGAGVTITGYMIGATTYPTLAALNAALAGTSIAGISGTQDVTVVYTVAAGQGGQNIPVSLTATSRRESGTSDASTTMVSPPVTGGATMVAGATAADRLPTGTAAAYSVTYTVTNQANASRTFDLAAVASNANVVVSSVNGGSATATVAAGATADIVVEYTVADVAAGSTGTITLTATRQDDNGIAPSAAHAVTVIRADLTLAKAAFRDDQSTAIGGTDRVLPGEYIYYRLTITNGGAADASSVSVSDVLPAQVTYDSHIAPAGWTVGEASGTVTATLTGTLAPSASQVIWIRVRIN
jgi:uncharacterized repeat protein (TIGR01451 family)